MRKIISLIIVIIFIGILAIIAVFVKKPINININNNSMNNNDESTLSGNALKWNNMHEDDNIEEIDLLQENSGDNPSVSGENNKITREEVINALINEVYNGKDYVEDGIYGINNIRELLIDVDEDGYDEIIKFGNWLAEDESVFSLYKYNEGKVEKANIDNNEIFFIGKVYSTTDGVYISDIKSDGPESNIFLYKLVSKDEGYTLKEVLGEYHIHSPKDNLDDDLYRYEGNEVSEEEYYQKIGVLNDNVYVNKSLGSYDWIEGLWKTTTVKNNSGD